MSQEATTQESWYSLNAAANLLQVSERTVHRWIQSGRLQSKRDESGRRVVKVDSRKTTAGQIEAAVTRVRQETQQKARQTEEALASVCEVNTTAQQIFDDAKLRVKMARRAVIASWAVAFAAVLMAVGLAVLLALSSSQRAEQVLALVDARNAAVSSAEIAQSKLNDTDQQLLTMKAQLRQLTLDLQSAENQLLRQQSWATTETVITMPETYPEP